MSRILDWIETKRGGREMDGEELAALVTGFTRGEIADYQMSAWLMAVTMSGMTLDETCALTEAILRSGETLDLSALPGPSIDKHSSGGVGDKITLALVPMLAASGAYMAKMSGHGLGLTGGTLDKLESVLGLRTELGTQEILDQVRDIGACLCAQSDSLVPADRAIYALRDVTGTVASIPLIASSIMSKKLACGADAILLDIKVGSGAFMQEIGQARELAQTCLEIGVRYGKRVTAVLSDMSQPLGRAVGGAVELREAMALLSPVSDCAEARLSSLTHALYAEAGHLIGWDVVTGGEGVLSSGDAYDKLSAIIERQGGDLVAFSETVTIDNIAESLAGQWQDGVVIAERDGYVQSLDALGVARCAAMLGASRIRKGDAIDYDAGLWIAKVPGELVKRGEPLAFLHGSQAARDVAAAQAVYLNACVIGDELRAESEVVLKVIRHSAKAAGDD